MPGKRTLTMGLPPRHINLQVPVQAKHDPTAKAAGETHAAITKQGMDTAMRPDLDDAQRAPVAGAPEPLAPDSTGGQDRDTQLPRGLRTGLEQLSGLDLADVQVHHDSPEPAALSAAAFARGTDIHLAPGQRHHLPHEAWHVVQQKQGRVGATRQYADGPAAVINDDPGLEREADAMGARAAALADLVQPFAHGSGSLDARAPRTDSAAPAQLRVSLPGGELVTSRALAGESTRAAPEAATAAGGPVVQRVNIKQAISPEQGGELQKHLGDAKALEYTLEDSQSSATVGEVLDANDIDLGPLELEPDALLQLRGAVLDTGKVNKLTWNYKDPRLERPTSVTWKLKVVASGALRGSAKPEKTGHDAETVGKNNERKIVLFHEFKEAMQAFGVPVFLVGGAVANVRYDSPRALKDLDLKTLAVERPFSEERGLVNAINEFVSTVFIPEKLSGASFEPFVLADKNPNAIDGTIAGCEVTIARILNPETMEQYDSAFKKDGVIAGLDMIIDKANAFIFRSSDQKKATDLFDLLWGMQAEKLDPCALMALLDERRGESYQKEVSAKESSRGGYHAERLSTQFALSLQELMSRGLNAVRSLLYQYVGDKQSAQKLIPLLKQLAAAFGVAFQERGGDPCVLVQAGNMTGDMFGVSSALILNPMAHVVVISDGSDKDRAASLATFYRSTVQDPERVHLLRVPLDSEQDMNRAYTTYAGRKKQPMPYGEITPLLPPALHSPDRQQPVSVATTQTAQHFDKKTSHDVIKKSWGVDPETNATLIEEFLTARSVPDASNYAVLWLRFSGKRGGPHAQHDTGFTAMRQMIHIALAEGNTVLLCGDRPGGEGKLDELVGLGAVDLVEFWNDSAWTERFPEGRRQDQLMAFDYLHQRASLRHLGFRSGNLEAYALLGHQVRYMEEAGNLQAGRMEAWHSDHRGGIGYDRIEINGRVPTLTGQWVTENAAESKSENKPPWIDDPLGDHKENYVPGPLRDPDYKRHQAPQRGFEVGDLEKIHEYLKSSDLPSGPTWLLELERKHQDYLRKGWRLLVDDLDEQTIAYLRDFQGEHDPQDPIPGWLDELLRALDHRDEEERQQELALRREQEEFNLREMTSEFDYWE